MKKVLNNPGLYFLLAVLLIFPLLVPNQQAVAASTTAASKSWSLQLNGYSLFNPASQDNGSLFVGNCQIIKNVYNADFMTIDSKGNKQNEWKIVGANQVDGDFLLGGTTSSPVIYSVVYSKGTIVTYNQKGQSLWNVNLKAPIDSASIDGNGSIIFSSKNKLYKYTQQGKQTLQINMPSYKDKIGNTTYYTLDTYRFLSDGSFYLMPFNEDGKFSSLIKYNASGSKMWGTGFISSADLNYLQPGNSVVYLDDKNTAYIEASFYNPHNPTTYSDDEWYTRVYAIDANGKVLWTQKLSSDSALFFDKYNSTIHIVSQMENYYTISDKGVLLKKQALTTNTNPGYPEGVQRLSSTGGFYVLVNGNQGHLVYFDSTSKKQWDKIVPNSTSNLWEFKNQLIFIGNKTIYAYSKDGNLNWKYDYNDNINWDAQIITNEKNSMIYLQTTNYSYLGGNNVFKTTITALRQINVTQTVPVATVSVNLMLTKGSTASFQAIVSPSNASNAQVTWTSSNPSVAMVDANGKVKAVKAGTAIISATSKDGGKQASIGVTIK